MKQNSLLSCGQTLQEGAVSTGKLPGTTDKEVERGRSRKGLLADGAKQLQEGLLILQAKTSHVLERGRERAF